jgi:hypothetical protein
MEASVHRLRLRIRNDRSKFDIATCSLALALLGGCVSEGDGGIEDTVGQTTEALRISSPHLRAFIAKQVGGLDKLKVPADDSAIPLPPEDPNRPGRYATTEAKRFLGKMLFHDPIRTTRVNINTNVNPPIREVQRCGRPVAGM